MRPALAGDPFTPLGGWALDGRGPAERFGVPESPRTFGEGGDLVLGSSFLSFVLEAGRRG